MSENYNTRLQADVSEAFETYLEENEISASEGARRFITYGLIRQGYLDDEKKVLSDGGRPDLFHTWLWAGVALSVGLSGLFGAITPAQTLAFGGAALCVSLTTAAVVLWRDPDHQIIGVRS